MRQAVTTLRATSTQVTYVTLVLFDQATFDLAEEVLAGL